jgi:hypothetical protein
MESIERCHHEHENVIDSLTTPGYVSKPVVNAEEAEMVKRCSLLEQYTFLLSCLLIRLPMYNGVLGRTTMRIQKVCERLDNLIAYISTKSMRAYLLTLESTIKDESYNIHPCLRKGIGETTQDAVKYQNIVMDVWCSIVEKTCKIVRGTLLTCHGDTRDELERILAVCEYKLRTYPSFSKNKK